VIAALRDLAPGERATPELLAVRSVPKEWATASVVKADGVQYIADQPVTLPIAQGEPVRWTHFLGNRAPDARAGLDVTEACTRAAPARAIPSTATEARESLAKEQR
jgi:hypothetical protein